MPARRFGRRKSSAADNNDAGVPVVAPLDAANAMVEALSSAGSGDEYQGPLPARRRQRQMDSAMNDNSATSIPDNFVTQPPRPAVKGLTGKISTLFRRESSRERRASDAASQSDATASHVRSTSPNSFRSGASSAVISVTSSQYPVSAADGSNNEDVTMMSRTRSQSAGGELSGRGVAAVAAVAAGSLAAAAAAASTQTQMLQPRQLQRRNSNDSASVARSVASVRSRSNKRIFYSSHQDDEDSEDSYESRASRNSQSSRNARRSSAAGGGRERGRGRTASRNVPVAVSAGVDSHETATTDGSQDFPVRSVDTNGDFSSYTDGSVKVIKRFRGFSTSIRSLFLDESLVCGAFGCFGLILSNRTEYLLQLRNERRGAAASAKNRFNVDQRRKMPSRIIATGLVLMLMLMFTTFVIWGFGTGNGIVEDYLNGYDYYDNGAEDQWDDYLDSNGYSSSKKSYSSSGNDDANNANYNDDGNNGDDQAAANENGDDAAAAAGDDARRRDLEELDTTLLQLSPMSSHHGLHGIFKIRDYQENFWDPIAAIVRNELANGIENENIDTTSGKSMASAGSHVGHRRNEDAAEAAATDDLNDGGEVNDASDGTAANSFNEYNKRRDLASDIRLALLIVFLVFLGVLGRRRRMRTRFYLVRARAQEDHLYYASSDEAASRRVALDDAREDQYEGACSHTLCGCYPIDEVRRTDDDDDDENVEVTDRGLFKRKKKPHHEDIVARTFNSFLSVCCGAACKCWFQCLSICALAQEAREVRLLIPPRYQRIDYITHQPFHEYQEAVNDLRRGWLGKARRVSGIMPHYNALSRLSRYILILSLSTILIIVATLVFNPRAAFSWQDAVVLVATFLQSFLVLFCVHWIFHKSDLSLDAVIKMFAAGFLIAVPTAFFFEGLLVNIMLFASYSLYYGFASVMGDSFADWVDVHWRAIWIVAELFNAYIVAAVTEELCKYYTFRAVEHPDLVFLTGLQRDSQDETAMEGGLVKYPFASHQVQKLARERSFGDDGSVSEHSHRSSRSNRRSRSFSRERSSRRETLIERTGTTDAEFDEDELDARTRRQKAMAITTGMISVAVGLACAENFLYVFVLGGALGDNPQDSRQGDLLEAWIVLFFRSIFPVHALAAAMQSINMIRKFVEHDEHNGHRVGVGRIILPAVILHGSFDAILMGINVFVETAWNNNDVEAAEAEPYNALAVNLVAWSSITAIMIGGLVWYYRENRKQGARLKVLEEQDKALQAEQWMEGASSREIEDRLV